jgi:hypothetical protein
MRSVHIEHRVLTHRLLKLPSSLLEPRNQLNVLTSTAQAVGLAERQQLRPLEGVEGERVGEDVEGGIGVHGEGRSWGRAGDAGGGVGRCSPRPSGVADVVRGARERWRRPREIHSTSPETVSLQTSQAVFSAISELR